MHEHRSVLLTYVHRMTSTDQPSEVTTDHTLTHTIRKTAILRPKELYCFLIQIYPDSQSYKCPNHHLTIGTREGLLCHSWLPNVCTDSPYLSQKTLGLLHC